MNLSIYHHKTVKSGEPIMAANLSFVLWNGSKYFYDWPSSVSQSEVSDFVRSAFGSNQCDPEIEIRKVGDLYECYVN